MSIVYLSLIIAFVNIGIGIVVLIRGRGSRLTNKFFWMSVYCTLWGIFDYFSLSSTSSTNAFILGGIRTIVSYITVVALLDFSLAYSGTENSLNKRLVQLFYAFAIVLSLVRFTTPFLASGMEYEGGVFRAIPGPLYSIPVGVALIIALFTMIVLFRFYKSLKEKQKKTQALLVLLGAGLVLVVAIITYTILPYFGFHDQSVGVTLMGIFPIAMGIALLRYELATQLSLKFGNLRSKVFSAAIVATFLVILPSTLLMSWIYVRDVSRLTETQLHAEVIEKHELLEEYFKNEITRAVTLANNTTSLDELGAMWVRVGEIQFSGLGTIKNISVIRLPDSNPFDSNNPYSVTSITVEGIETKSVVITTPLRHIANEKLYLRVTTSADALLSILSTNESMPYKTEVSYLIDEHNKELAQSASSASTNNDLTFSGTLTCQNAPEHTTTLFADYLNKAGTPVLGTINLLDQGKLCLAIEVSKAEVNFALQRIIIISFLIAFLTLTFVTVLAEKLGELIARPVLSLMQGVSKVSAGDLSAKIEVSSHDEIGTFSKAFNFMTEKLRESRENITEKVNAQTKDLEEQKQQLIKQQKKMIHLLEELEDEKSKSDVLAQDLAKFKLAVDYAHDQIVITDPEGTIIYANDSVEQLTGYKPEEVLGQKAGSKANWGGNMPHEFYEKLWKTIKIQKKPFVGEVVNKHKNGSNYIVLATISPVLDNDDNILFFVGLERDITKEKNIDRAKSEFVSLASHQLRTPLSAVNWYTEMLLDGDAGKLNKTLQAYVNEIYTGNQRMIDLVGALLNVSRLELGTFMVEPTKQSLQDIGNEVLKELEPLRRSKEITLIKDFEKLPEILVDRKLMYIIFQNLTSNALKYTPEHGQVTISLTKLEKHVQLKVVDNGIGIPIGEQKHIFEKLFRASNAKESVIEGTGLGLYIIKAILDSTGGKITAESEAGKGSTFTVLIPLKGMRAKTGTKRLG